MEHGGYEAHLIFSGDSQQKESYHSIFQNHLTKKGGKENGKREGRA